DGPGLTILEAAEAVGIPTINNSRAIRLIRDKAVAVAFAQACELPVPITYFVGHPRALVKVPHQVYPVVVKPSNGTSLQDIHLDGPGLTILEAAEAVGIPTINNSRAIRLIRDKAVAVAFAQACELPVPITYFVGHPRALVKVPHQVYPVVVKPSNGTSLQDIH